jgi:hypothetical protein
MKIKEKNIKAIERICIGRKESKLLIEVIKKENKAIP